MTPYRNRLSPLTQRMAEDMLVRNLAANTIDAYTYHVDRFVDFAGRPAEQLGPEEIRAFQLHLIRDKKVGWSSFNQAVCGLRFLYRFTLPRPWHVEMIPFGKRPKKLPLVLGHEQATRLIECTTNLKHRTLLLTLYAAGLRLSEATHLQVTDIDSPRMQLKVMHGKGAKQRLVPMSPRLLAALRDYWREYRPPTYLFPGRDHDTPISGTTMQKALKAAAREAGLSPQISPHTLRKVYSYYLSSLRLHYWKGISACLGSRLGSWRPLRTAATSDWTEVRVSDARAMIQGADSITCVAGNVPAQIRRRITV